MSESRHRRLTDAELEEAERLELIAAVEEALADLRPDIPHEVVAAEMEESKREIARDLRRKSRPGDHVETNGNGEDTLTDEELVEADRLLLVAAVEEARADPGPDIPQEAIDAEMDGRMEALERKIAALLPPVA